MHLLHHLDSPLPGDCGDRGFSTKSSVLNPNFLCQIFVMLLCSNFKETSSCTDLHYIRWSLNVNILVPKTLFTKNTLKCYAAGFHTESRNLRNGEDALIFTNIMVYM